MSNFRAVRDNPYARNIVNIYKDGKLWNTGEALPSGIIKLPAFDTKGQQHAAVVHSLSAANHHLNKYQGLTKGSARKYLKVS